MINQQNNPIEMKTRAVSIFKDFIELLYMVIDEHPTAAKIYLTPILPGFLNFQFNLK